MIYQPGPDKPVYPDITVVCGEPAYRDAHNDVILNPHVVVEVLSSSTRNYDRGDKFEGYTSMTSLTEYVVIEQSKVLVELRTRQGDAWVITKQTNLESHIRLSSLGISVSVRAIHDGAGCLAQPFPDTR